MAPRQAQVDENGQVATGMDEAAAEQGMRDMLVWLPLNPRTDQRGQTEGVQGYTQRLGDLMQASLANLQDLAKQLKAIRARVQGEPDQKGVLIPEGKSATDAPLLSVAAQTQSIGCQLNGMATNILELL